MIHVRFSMDFSYFFAIPSVFFLTGMICYYLELGEYYVKDNIRGKGDRHYHFGILPFINPYAFAGVLLYIIVRDFQPTNYVLFFIIAFLCSGIFEVLTGLIAEKIVNRKLWDYSSVPFNILGYTTPFHMFVWATLSVVSIMYIFPFVVSKVQSYENIFQIVDIFSIILFFVVILLSIKKPLYFVKFK
jgi:uncharacterized membrane protein